MNWRQESLRKLAESFYRNLPLETDLVLGFTCEAIWGQNCFKKYVDTYSYFPICTDKQKRSWKINLDILWDVITQSCGKVTLLLNNGNKIKLKRTNLFYGNYVLNIFTHVLKLLRFCQSYKQKEIWIFGQVYGKDIPDVIPQNLWHKHFADHPYVIL